MNKKTIFAAIATGLLIVSSCAKPPKATNNANAKLYFDSWISIHLPQAEKVGKGIYILPEMEIEGTGAETVSDSCYVMVNYTKRTLDGSIVESSTEEKAKQLGIYNKANYYGPKIIYTLPGSTQAGIYEALYGMKRGASRVAIIPGWLASFDKFDTEEEYLNKHKDGEHTIQEFEVVDFTKDIDAKRLTELEAYCKEELNLTLKDTLKKGFFYKELFTPTNPADTAKFNKDTTVYINYTGRLLNGQVFDTTIEDTAKVWHIYTPNRAYKPVRINWAEFSNELTMGENSSLITGFTDLLWRMGRPYTKATGVFYYKLGYMEKGSGATIPPFASLRFDIEFTADPDAKK